MGKKLLIFLLAVSVIVTAVLGITLVGKGAAAAPVDGQEGVKLPIVMYHSILNDWNRSGKYIVTPDQLEQDLKYLKENGYTTVTMSQVIDYVNGRGSLPGKPVILTFDDGNYNNYSYLYPLLKKYDMKAVISVIGRYSDLYSELDEKPNNNYSNLTWDMMREMEESGHVEIQSHTYNLHGNDGRHGLEKGAGESDEQYRSAIYSDLVHMQERMREELGHEASTLAYPFGYMTASAQEVIRDLGIQASLSSYERVSIIRQGDPESLYDLGRYNRAAGKSPAQFFGAMK